MANLMDILRQAGFSGEGLNTAYAIAMAESSGNARAFNGDTSTGDQSYGLFQINMLGGMGPERRRQYGLGSNDDLFDAITNAKVAYKMSKGGTDWSPWSTYKRGDYTKYLGRGGATVADTAPPASAAPSGPEAPQQADIIGSGVGEDFAPTYDSFAKTGRDFAGTSTPPGAAAPAAVPAVKFKGGATSFRDKVVAAAMGVLGTPYSWGGGSTSGASRGIDRGANTVGFDCSGLLLYAFAQAGYSMPRLSWDQLSLGSKAAIGSLRPGDLVGFGTGGHLAMYLGDGKIIESPRTGLTVRVRTLGPNESAWGVRLNLPGD